jgi:16S rRNA (cytosine1402-N4)-methyltransferase
MSERSGDAVHVPVLLREVIEQLGAERGGMFLDCTFGGGGHTRAILEASPDNWVVALDRDARALERGSKWAARYGERLTLIHSPFSQAATSVGSAKFDGVLADLGMSTDQLHEGRGFSFQDAALDMRMDENSPITARDFLNSASEKELYIALAEGGVGATARQLARILVSERPFSSAQELADLVRSSNLGKDRSTSRVHPATVVFQALRMKVNREREEIEELMQGVPGLIKGDGARLAVITFHSVEDTLVVREMRRWEAAGSYPASWRGARAERKLGRVSPRKPICPTVDEVTRNPASRSARLRVFEFGE